MFHLHIRYKLLPDSKVVYEDFKLEDIQSCVDKIVKMTLLVNRIYFIGIVPNEFPALIAKNEKTTTINLTYPNEEKK